MSAPVWSVVPYMVGATQSGWSVVRNGIAVQWFPQHRLSRALNEARYRNAAELLRLQREQQSRDVAA